jgi:hypothetical protein
MDLAGNSGRRQRLERDGYLERQGRHGRQRDIERSHSRRRQHVLRLPGELQRHEHDTDSDLLRYLSRRSLRPTSRDRPIGRSLLLAGSRFRTGQREAASPRESSPLPGAGNECDGDVSLQLPS